MIEAQPFSHAVLVRQRGMLMACRSRVAYGAGLMGLWSAVLLSVCWCCFQVAKIDRKSLRGARMGLLWWAPCWAVNIAAAACVDGSAAHGAAQLPGETVVTCASMCDIGAGRCGVLTSSLQLAPAAAARLHACATRPLYRVFQRQPTATASTGRSCAACRQIASARSHPKSAFVHTAAQGSSCIC